MRVWMLVVLALALAPLSGAHAHTVDAIDDKYRIEIGWMNEPMGRPTASSYSSVL